LTNLAAFYFGSTFSIFEHEVCIDERSASFAYGVLLGVVHQSSKATIGLETKEVCHIVMGNLVSLVSLSQKNDGERGVEDRHSIIDQDITNCKFSKSSP
jgi:hypothetical protein